MTALPLEDRLKQHRMNGKNYKKLFLIDLFMVLNEARNYEKVIEELMTDPKHNKEHLFTNENNSLHPQRDKEFYEDATAWAVENILERLQNKLNILTDGRRILTYIRKANLYSRAVNFIILLKIITLVSRCYWQILELASILG